MSKSESEINRPCVTADVVPVNIHATQFRESGAFINLVLIKRGSNSSAYPNMWALPGGLLEEGESLESCAARELEEETGIKVKMLIPSGIFSDPSRDPRGQTISASFIAILPSGEFAPLKFRAGDDAAEVGLFNLNKTYVDVQGQKVHVEARCVEKDVFFSFDATFGREEYGRIVTHISWRSATRLAFDHADIIARAFWQKSMLFENTAKFASREVHEVTTAEQDIKKKLQEHLTE